MADSVDPDQTPHSAASDMGLHFLLRLSVQLIMVNSIVKMRNKQTDLCVCRDF